MKRFFLFSFLISVLISSIWIIAPSALTIPLVEAQNRGTRCTTTGDTKFLRFDYVPAQNAGYIPNKSIIYVPKEAQCQGSFPMYVLLHGNNGRPGDVSSYYLPNGELGSSKPGHPQEQGEGRFQSAIEAAIRNTNVPGMIFVVPANSVTQVAWSGLDGPLLKQKVQQALDSDPSVASLGIHLSNDVLVSGHSGAVCGDDLTQFRSLNPIGVAVLDGCSSVYSSIISAYPRSTILLYAADMAYDSGTFVNGVETGGYHNDVPRDFQDLAQCDTNIFTSPPRAGNTHAPSSSGATRGHPAAEVTHFKAYWQNPLRACTKSPTKPWYSLFATGIDHVGAVGAGMKTFLNIVYNNQPPPETVAGGNTGSSGQANFTVNNPQAGTAQQVTVPLASGQVGLEAGINGTTSIDGGGQGYILNYARILFVYIGGLAGTLALLMLIVSGIQIIMGGSGEQVKKSTERILNTLGGLALLATSGFILYLINPCFFTFGTSQACVPRAINGVNYFPATGSAVGPVSIIQSGTPPSAPQASCDTNNICEVRLPARFLVQGNSPRECEYAGNCATTPNLADHTDADTGTVSHKWAGVSCGATATLIAINYVKGTNIALSDFINNYYRCGIRDLPPARAARINGYSAASAPRAWNDNLCAYILGIGGDPSKLTKIMRQEFGLTHVRNITPDADAIFAELGQGHPIIIEGISTMGHANQFVPRGHFTTIVGIQGYNASTHQFTNLLIHDVGYAHGANNLLSWENYNTIRPSIDAAIAVGA